MGVASKWWMAIILLWLLLSVITYTTNSSNFTQQTFTDVNGMVHMTPSLNSWQTVWNFLTQAVTFWQQPFFNTTIGMWVYMLVIAFTLPVIIPVGYQIVVLLFKPFGGS